MYQALAWVLDFADRQLLVKGAFLMTGCEKRKVVEEASLAPPLQQRQVVMARPVHLLLSPCHIHQLLAGEVGVQPSLPATKPTVSQAKV